MSYSYIIGLIGMWIMCDGVYSLAIYLRHQKQGQSWLYDHPIRVIRVLLGVGLMLIGGLS